MSVHFTFETWPCLPVWGPPGLCLGVGLVYKVLGVVAHTGSVAQHCLRFRHFPHSQLGFQTQLGAGVSVLHISAPGGLVSTTAVSPTLEAEIPLDPCCGVHM